VSRETFYLKIDVKTDGEENDDVYRWLTNQLYAIDGIEEVSELPDPEFTGQKSA